MTGSISQCLLFLKWHKPPGQLLSFIPRECLAQEDTAKDDPGRPCCNSEKTEAITGEQVAKYITSGEE